MAKVSHNDSVPVMSHIESSIINRYESEVKIGRSRDCSTKRNEICNTTPPLDSYGFQTLTVELWCIRGKSRWMRWITVRAIA
jgi:hypothetical protein